MTQLIALEVLRLDGGTQPRAEIDLALVEDYAEEYRKQALDPRLPKFPPVVVYFDGEHHWLAGGFHRYRARLEAEFTKIEADIRQGTRRDAVWFSSGENAEHGLRRTNEDKHRAVRKLLEDEEWRKKSDRALAEQAKVTQPFVTDLRNTLFPSSTESGYQTPLRTVTRAGTTFTMNVTGINAGRTGTGQSSAPAASGSGGHREVHERSRFLAINETMDTIISAQRTLPDPRVAAENSNVDLDEAYRVSLWWTQFAAFKRQNIERAS